MVRIKTVTIHLDYNTWEEYNRIKNKISITWTGIIEDWFKNLATERSDDNKNK